MRILFKLSENNILGDYMKKIHMLLPILLVMSCFLCQADAYAAAAKVPCETQSEEIYIYTAEQLAAICVEGSGKQYVLGNDIDIPHSWVPIGHNVPGKGDAASSTQEAAFRGSLDGRGHSITGLSIDVTGSGTFGLFGKLEDANIRNIVLEDASIRISGDAYGRELAAGLLAGEAVGCVINNVTIKSGCISATGSNLESTVVGGLAGRLISCTVEKTTANVQINVNAEAAGGIVGLALDTSFLNSGIDSGVIKGKSSVGGFAGQFEGTGIIQECYSHADVIGEIVGGFAGRISGSQLQANANHALEVVGCKASGKVVSEGGAAASGIAGGFAGESEYVFIKDSAAYGDVKGDAYAGGFVGRLSCLSRVMYAYAKGNALARGFAGGFVGELAGGACVEFSYSAGTVVVQEENDKKSPHQVGAVALEAAAGGFVGVIAHGAPNTLTHCLSFAPWVVGDGYVHRFAGRVDHDGINGCYALLGSMVVRGGSIAHVLPNAFGPDGADMSRSQVEEVANRLGWRRPIQPTSHLHS